MWNLFPLEWSSLFFGSEIGSNITLFLLFAVITLPMCWIFSKLTNINVSFSFSLIINIACLFAVVYTFSIFRYEQRQWIVASIVIQVILNLLVIGFSKLYSSDNNAVLFKKNPLYAIGTALLYTAFTDILTLLLFYSMTYSFYQA